MTDTLRGQVESVRLFRDSWGVMRLLTGSASETTEVVGTMLGFDVGDTLEVDGCFETHPRYGRRFKASAFRVLIPTDASGAIAWLIGRMPAIGRRLATELVERYGIPGVWDVLEREPGRLVELRGITPERAAKIGEAYQRHVGERDRIVALKRYQLTDRQIAKIQDALGVDALDAIRRDPYLLIEKVDGFGWARADDLARRLGLPADHPSRLRAAIMHVLDEARAAGNTRMVAGKLVAVVSRITGQPEALVRREANAVLESGRIVMRAARVYTAELDEAEQAVADAVRRMVGARGERGREGGERSEAA